MPELAQVEPPLQDVPAPPVAPRRPHVLVAHGDERVDDWYWLRDRNDPGVIAYLEAENAYTDAVLAPAAPLRQRLYQEIKSRIVEDDVSAPARKGCWWYYTRTFEGLQYVTHCRRHDAEGGAITALEAFAQVGRPGEEH